MNEGAFVIDASAFVDLLLDVPAAKKIAELLDNCVLYAPAHFSAEVLSALGRLFRNDNLTDSEVSTAIAELRAAPIHYIHLADHIEAAWRLRENYRLADALYLALADHLGCRLVTTDRKLRDVALVVK